MSNFLSRSKVMHKTNYHNNRWCETEIQEGIRGRKPVTHTDAISNEKNKSDLHDDSKKVEMAIQNVRSGFTKKGSEIMSCGGFCYLIW